MNTEEYVRRRRRSEVYRNIDDSLKVGGLLTLKSCAILFGLYFVSYLADLLTNFWRLFGPGGFVLEAGFFVVVGTLLLYAERQDDEHLIPAMVRFWVARPWRVLYSGFTPDGWPAHDLEWVFEARGARLSSENSEAHLGGSA